MQHLWIRLNVSDRFATTFKLLFSLMLLNNGADSVTKLRIHKFFIGLI